MVLTVKSHLFSVNHSEKMGPRFISIEVHACKDYKYICENAGFSLTPK